MCLYREPLHRGRLRAVPVGNDEPEPDANWNEDGKPDSAPNCVVPRTRAPTEAFTAARTAGPTGTATRLATLFATADPTVSPRESWSRDPAEETGTGTPAQDESALLAESAIQTEADSEAPGDAHARRHSWLAAGIAIGAVALICAVCLTGSLFVGGRARGPILWTNRWLSAIQIVTPRQLTQNRHRDSMADPAVLNKSAISLRKKFF